jgi:hypothetical protein
MAICAERHVDDSPAISLGKLKWQKVWDARAVSLSHQGAMARVLRYSGFWSWFDACMSFPNVLSRHATARVFLDRKRQKKSGNPL